MTTAARVRRVRAKFTNRAASYFVPVCGFKLSATNLLLLSEASASVTVLFACCTHAYPRVVTTPIAL